LSPTLSLAVASFLGSLKQQVQVREKATHKNHLQIAQESEYNLGGWSVQESTFSKGGVCKVGGGTAPLSLPIKNNWRASSSFQLVACYNINHNNNPNIP